MYMSPTIFRRYGAPVATLHSLAIRLTNERLQPTMVGTSSHSYPICHLQGWSLNLWPKLLETGILPSSIFDYICLSKQPTVDQVSFALTAVTTTSSRSKTLPRFQEVVSFELELLPQHARISHYMQQNVADWLIIVVVVHVLSQQSLPLYEQMKNRRPSHKPMKRIGKPRNVADVKRLLEEDRW